MNYYKPHRFVLGSSAARHRGVLGGLQRRVDPRAPTPDPALTAVVEPDRAVLVRPGFVGRPTPSNPAHSWGSPRMGCAREIRKDSIVTEWYLSEPQGDVTPSD